MKNIFFFFMALFIFSANVLYAQTNTCNLIGTKWKIRNVEIKRVGGSIEDSLSEKRFYQKFDSVELSFINKKNIIVSWKQYKILGMYKIKESDSGKVLVFTKWKHFGFYENGSFERSEFAVFLYPFKSRVIPFLKDCSFMILSKSRGIDCEIVYKKIE
jgi:hypothetical protein